MKPLSVNSSDIESFERDGAVLIKGLFSGFIDQITTGIDKNLSNPGKYAADNLTDGELGRFFDDYCNWQNIPEFKDTIFNSSVGYVAAQLMRSSKVQLFHEHVLVKEPGTIKPTPWHQDSPYYFVDGSQTVSFWSPMDKVTTASLRCVAGSHKWQKPVLPTPRMDETKEIQRLRIKSADLRRSLTQGPTVSKESQIKSEITEAERLKAKLLGKT